MPERRQPLRFVWTMDADERFTLAVRDFADAMGPRTAQVIGKPWSEIADALALDPEGRVAKAVASRDTWSGVTHRVAGRGDRRDHDGGTVRPADLRSRPQFPRLSRLRGLPRRRACAGAARRGAGRRDGAAAPPPEAPAPAEARPLLTVVPAAKNVVPFRGAVRREKRPALTPIERSAFHELAETLGKAPASRPASPTDASTHRAEAGGRRAREDPPTALPSAFAQRGERQHASTPTPISSSCSSACPSAC